MLRLDAVRGRVLNDDDGRNGQLGIVINERLASLYFPDRDAVGARVALDAAAGAPGSWATVVGVVPDVRQFATPDLRPVAYLPLGEEPPATATVIARGVELGAAALRERFRQLDPALPLDQVQTLAAARRNVQWVGRMSERLALTVVIASVLLAVAGLYAVLAHRMTVRTREIGVRVALGASPRHIAALVGRSVRGALVLGLALGLAGVFAWSRAFAPDTAASSAARVRLVLATIASLAVVALVAAAFPARRAARLPAAEALRRD